MTPEELYQKYKNKRITCTNGKFGIVVGFSEQYMVMVMAIDKNCSSRGWAFRNDLPIDCILFDDLNNSHGYIFINENDIKFYSSPIKFGR